jgi:hypothetical protein
MDIRYRDDSYVMARPSGQALFHSGLAAAPRNPVPVTIPRAAGRWRE